jgi:hypothetical protein
MIFSLTTLVLVTHLLSTLLTHLKQITKPKLPPHKNSTFNRTRTVTRKMLINHKNNKYKRKETSKIFAKIDRRTNATLNKTVERVKGKVGSYAHNEHHSKTIQHKTDITEQARHKTPSGE